MRRQVSLCFLTLSMMCVSLLAIGQDWGTPMIDLGKNDVSEGILLLPGGDGVTEPDTIGGEDARVISKAPPGLPTAGNHAYFIVDSTVVPDKADADKLWIGVEYFDDAVVGATGIFLDYDDKGDLYPDQAFAINRPRDERVIPFTNTGEWQIAIIAIEEAEFKEQGNGADFRFHIDPYLTDAFYLNRVWINNNELTLEDLGGVFSVQPDKKLAVAWAAVKNELPK